jgi:hypothetical protein
MTPFCHRFLLSRLSLWVFVACVLVGVCSGCTGGKTQSAQGFDRVDGLAGESVRELPRSR